MKKRKGKVNIYDYYRQSLNKPELTNKEIDGMRKNVQLVVQAICEHVWGKEFY